MKLNKKGALLEEETVKTIIAVIVIVLLILLLFDIYASFSGQSDLQDAQGTVARLQGEINSVSISGKPITDTLYEPKNWILEYYNSNAPSACQSASCLCLCEGTGLFHWSQLSACNADDACKDLTNGELLSNFNPLDTTPAINIVISKDNGGIEISSSPSK